MKRDGIAPFVDIVSWIAYWKELIDPKVLTLFGGEPCLHPELLTICEHIRSAWPDTTIRLITNGYLLNNFDSAEWFKFEPFEMQISMHRADHRSHINSIIKNILKQRTNWRVVKHGVNTHKQAEWVSGAFSLYKSIFKDFVVPYRLDNNKILPYASDPVDAHKLCGSPNTPILYKGHLYKCPPVANIIDITDTNPMNYRRCEGADTLDEFISNINKPEPVCSQCPAGMQATVVDHFDIKNVQVRHKIIS